MNIRHTGTFDLRDEITDMAYLAHLSAIGTDIIDQSIYAGEDWTHVHAAHQNFLSALQRVYENKWTIGRQHRKQ